MAIPATKRRYNVTLDAALAARLDAVAALRRKHRSTIIHWAVEDWLRRYEPGIRGPPSPADERGWPGARYRRRLPSPPNPIPRRTRARSTWRTRWRPHGHLSLQTAESTIGGSEGASSAAPEKRCSPLSRPCRPCPVP